MYSEVAKLQKKQKQEKIGANYKIFVSQEECHCYRQARDWRECLVSSENWSWESDLWASVISKETKKMMILKKETQCWVVE